MLEEKLESLLADKEKDNIFLKLNNFWEEALKLQQFLITSSQLDNNSTWIKQHINSLDQAIRIAIIIVDDIVTPKVDLIQPEKLKAANVNNIFCWLNNNENITVQISGADNTLNATVTKEDTNLTVIKKAYGSRTLIKETISSKTPTRSKSVLGESREHHQASDKAIGLLSEPDKKTKLAGVLSKKQIVFLENVISLNSKLLVLIGLKQRLEEEKDNSEFISGFKSFHESIDIAVKEILLLSFKLLEGESLKKFFLEKLEDLLKKIRRKDYQQAYIEAISFNQYLTPSKTTEEYTDLRTAINQINYSDLKKTYAREATLLAGLVNIAVEQAWLEKNQLLDLSGLVSTRSAPKPAIFFIEEKKIFLSIEEIQSQLKVLKSDLKPKRNLIGKGNIDNVLINLIDQATNEGDIEKITKLVAFICLYLKTVIAESEDPNSTKTIGLLINRDVVKNLAVIFKVETKNFDLNKNPDLKNAIDQLIVIVDKFFNKLNETAIKLYNKQDISNLFFNYFQNGKIAPLLGEFCDEKEIGLDIIKNEGDRNTKLASGNPDDSTANLITKFSILGLKNLGKKFLKKEEEEAFVELPKADKV